MQKIDSQLRKLITEIIQKEVDDPDLTFLSITRVKTTSDLQESKVYFSILNDAKYTKAKEVLEAMSGFIRGTLGKKVRLKKLPRLDFIPDDSMKYSVDIYKKVEEMKENDVRNSPEKDNRKNKTS
jgi:ribosome-binding factor A